MKERLIRLAAAHRPLEIGEPGADRQPEAPQAVLPDVDARLFLERKGEAGDAVIERHGADAEFRLVDQDAGCRDRRRQRLPMKGIARVELGRDGEQIFMQLRDADHEVRGIARDQVPGIGGQLVLDPVDEAGRAKQLEAQRPAEADAQQPVEPAEVVHVGVRDKDVADPQQLPRRQRVQVAKVEQQGAPAEAKVEIETRVAERIVDQPRRHEPGHPGASLPGSRSEMFGWRQAAVRSGRADPIRGRSAPTRMRSRRQDRPAVRQVDTRICRGPSLSAHRFPLIRRAPRRQPTSVVAMPLDPQEIPILVVLERELAVERSVQRLADPSRQVNVRRRDDDLVLGPPRSS